MKLLYVVHDRMSDRRHWDSGSAKTPLSLNIVNNITLRRNVLLVFCCKVLNTKKTNIKML